MHMNDDVSLQLDNVTKGTLDILDDIQNISYFLLSGFLCLKYMLRSRGS